MSSTIQIRVDEVKEERAQIVADSLGNIDATCDGCMAGLTVMIFMTSPAIQFM